MRPASETIRTRRKQMNQTNKRHASRREPRHHHEVVAALQPAQNEEGHAQNEEGHAEKVKRASRKAVSERCVGICLRRL